MPWIDWIGNVGASFPQLVIQSVGLLVSIPPEIDAIRRRALFCIALPCDARRGIRCSRRSSVGTMGTGGYIVPKAQPISRFHGRDADREMEGFPWNGQFSVKFREILQFCPFAYTFSQYFPMHVLCSSFAITFTHIINNYRLKRNPFALCLLTVYQPSDVTLNVEAEWSDSQYTAAIALNVSPCQSILWWIKSSLPRTRRLRIIEQRNL